MTDAELAYRLEGELNEARAALAVARELIRALADEGEDMRHDRVRALNECTGCFEAWPCKFARAEAFLAASLDVQEAGQ